MEELLKQMTAMQAIMIAMQKELAEVKQSQARIESDTKSGFANLDKKMDQLAAEGQKDVIAMIGLMNKKLDKRLDQIETKIDIL